MLTVIVTFLIKQQQQVKKMIENSRTLDEACRKVN